MGITKLFLLIFLWGMIWGVPASIAGHRRNKNKPAYYLLLIMAMAIELLIALGILQLTKIGDLVESGLFISPIVGSFIGSYLYWYLANKKDKSTANKAPQSMPKSGAAEL